MHDTVGKAHLSKAQGQSNSLAKMTSGARKKPPLRNRIHRHMECQVQQGTVTNCNVGFPLSEAPAGEKDVPSRRPE